MNVDVDPNSGDMAAVIDTALTAASAERLNTGDQIAVFTVPAGAHLESFDVEEQLAKHRPIPARKTGSFRAHDAESFVGYMAKHGVAESEVWADALSQQIVGVINAHEGASGVGGAGWGDHRVVYKVDLTPSWQAWKANDGKLMGQSEFAELIEDRLVDIIRPDAADLLELVQTFQATIGVKYESSKLLSSGERQLVYREQVDATAGRAGQFEIPKDFELAIQPFAGAEVFPIVARFRYRITDGTLRIGYKLNRPDDILRDAFESVVTNVEAGVSVPVYRGVSG